MPKMSRRYAEPMMCKIGEKLLWNSNTIVAKEVFNFLTKEQLVIEEEASWFVGKYIEKTGTYPREISEWVDSLTPRMVPYFLKRWFKGQVQQVYVPKRAQHQYHLSPTWSTF